MKVICVTYEGLAAQTHRGKRKVGTSRVSFVGDKCWAGSLFMWFPAAWMPLVAEAIHGKNRKEVAHHDTVVPSASANYPAGIAFKMKRWHVDRSGQTPILHGSANVSWLTLDPKRIVVHLFPTLYEGMLADVYYRKVATAWEKAVMTRVQFSMLLPSWEPAEAWLYLVRSFRHLWPLQMSTIGTLPKVAAKTFMSKERRRLRARHIWEKLDLNWPEMKERIFTGMHRRKIYNILFGSPHQSSARWQEAMYRGPGAAQLWESWAQVKNHYLARRHVWGPAALDMTEFFRSFEEEDYAMQKQLEELQELKVHVWRTRKGIYRKKQFPDVRDVEMDEETL